MNRSAEHVTKNVPPPLLSNARQTSRIPGLTEQVSLVVKFYIVDYFLVALQRPLELPRLPVPYLDGRIFARRGKQRILRVKGHARYALSVSCQHVSSGGTGNPISLHSCTLRGRERKLFLEGCISGLEFHDL